MNELFSFLASPLPIRKDFILPSRAILSPMEGVMSSPLFHTCAKFLALTDSWMTPFLGISPSSPPSVGALRRKYKTLLAEEKVLTLQFLGHDPKAMSLGAKAAVRAGFRSININFGCPSGTVLRTGSGGSLLKQPEKMKEILESIRENAPEITLSVKLRTGFADPLEMENYLPEMKKWGADWVILHYRTVTENYRKMDKETRKERLAAASRMLDRTLPLFGNGDILTVSDAKEVILCGCQGTACGRGLFQNPFLLRELKGEQVPENGKREFLNFMRDKVAEQFWGDGIYLESVLGAFGKDSPEFREAMAFAGELSKKKKKRKR